MEAVTQALTMQAITVPHNTLNPGTLLFPPPGYRRSHRTRPGTADLHEEPGEHGWHTDDRRTRLRAL